ncbi:MAG: GAF domain-containing protein [Deltaproteobacteria bacterium]|nr:GAF domain-containing protein [Deltaproteobacteria bacterium]
MKKKEFQYFEALYEVARVINASLDPARVLEKILRCVQDSMKVKACSIRLLDERRKRLLMSAAAGLSRKYITKGPVLIEESGLDRKALQGKMTWVRDAQKDRDFQYTEEARKEGIKSVFVVPLQVGEKVIGVMRVYTKEIRPFSKQEIRFLEAVANLSAIALENAQMHHSLRTSYDLLTEHKYRLDDH